jgi:outer membrane protein insertion porin family
VWAVLMACGAALAQDPVPVEPRHQDEGKIVRDIVVEPPIESAGGILRLLKTRIGEPLKGADVKLDLETLWSRLNIVGGVEVEDVEGGIRVIVVVEETSAYDRFEFKGLGHFTEREARTLLGLDPRQRLNRLAAQQYAATLRDRYRRSGYAFVQVRVLEDPARSTLTFQVDEGPKVTVRDVRFRGNATFPGWAALGLYDNLIGSASLESKPAGKILSGSPYSEEVLEEDLDRLRFFYRRQGFRDARVELAGAVFSADRSTVDVTLRIVEGRRYRIASVDLEQTPPPGRTEPLYAKGDVLAEVQVSVGDYYDYALITIDKNRIADFYGKRGHPQRNRYGRGIENAFVIEDPRELFDPEKGEVHLVYQVVEGTPKRLRDVVIRGNDHTRDHVIRRKVFLFPGDTLDMSKVTRSQVTLDGLRYFQDPKDFSGVRFELLPVEQDPDIVDLAIDVKEGNTGSFLWGAGVSTGAGVQARFVLSKRNFDITRLPSSPNPLTIVSEIADNSAFHGAGQELELMLAPGSELSLFQISFYDPDILRQHFDTIGLRVQAFRRLQFFDSFDMDSLGVVVGLERNFTENVAIGLSLRQETVEIENVDANAPTLVFGDEGSTEMRGARLNLNLKDQDHPLRPTDGYSFRAYGEVVGGLFGADEDFVKGGLSADYYLPLWVDSLERAHVVHVRQSFDYGRAFGRSDDLFLTERFYMGGSTLRGFDQRRAGPSQFGQPLGGEARYLSTVEYQFPLVSTRPEGQLRQTEVLRGVAFTDMGLLGRSIDTEDFGELRLSVGFGLRIQVPLIEVPIALDLGWPMLREATDRQRQFFFSLARF